MYVSRETEFNNKKKERSWNFLKLTDRKLFNRHIFFPLRTLSKFNHFKHKKLKILFYFNNDNTYEKYISFNSIHPYNIYLFHQLYKMMIIRVCYMLPLICTKKTLICRKKKYLNTFSNFDTYKYQVRCIRIYHIKHAFL